MKPLVSIIMPVYNTPESELREAIESILNQTFKDFEFIIIDDCSKHSIKDIVESYGDPRIIFIRNKENLGVTGAPNIGIKIARGKYIARMDSDDISLPERLEKQVNFLNSNKDTDVLGCAFEKFPKKHTIHYPLHDSEIKNTLLFSHNAICHPTTMIRKSTFDVLKIKYNKAHEVCEDYGLWLTYINDIKFANLDDVLLKYRWNGKNISKRKTYIQSINSQILMFEAQGKHFGLDYKPAIDIVNKFKENKIVTSKDLNAMNGYILEVKKFLSKEYPKCAYNVNRVFYKNFLKKCVSDVVFIKTLFSEEFNDIVKLSLFEKLGMIIGI